jgi:hypothetical protein
MQARKDPSYDLTQVADLAVDYLREEYEEVDEEVKKCEKAESEEAAVTGTTYAAAGGTMAGMAVANAGGGSMMGGMASGCQVFNAMSSSVDYAPTFMETATDGMSGGGMAPESEETKSLKKLRCSMKGLNKMKKTDEDEEDIEGRMRVLRMLEEESEAGIIPINFIESVAPFFFMFCAMLVFYLFVFSFKSCCC